MMKRLIGMILLIFCTNMNGIICFAAEDGHYIVGNDSFKIKENEFHWDLPNSSIDMEILPNGVYEANGKNYLIKEGDFARETWYDGKYYTELWTEAANEVYEFSESADREFWSAVEIVENTSIDNQGILIKYGFPFYQEAVAYYYRISRIYNFTSDSMEITIGKRPGDWYYYIYITNSETNHRIISEMRQTMELVDMIYNTLEIENLTEQGKVKVIHDWLINNLKYDYSLENRGIHEGLTEGSTVCMGYAQGFYLLCKKAGIDVECICGVALDNSTGEFNMEQNHHAWNRILFTGEKEYKYFDVTWDSNIVESINDLDRNRYTLERWEEIETEKYRYYMVDDNTFSKEHYAFYVFK